MTSDRTLAAIDATLTATEAPMHEPIAAPYDAGDAAPRRHIALTPPSADEQNRALTAQLNRHHTALQTANRELDEAVGMLARIGDAISPTGERPEEALGTLVADVEAVVRQRDALEVERDDLRIQLANVTAERDRAITDHAKALQRVDRLDREATTWKQRLVTETEGLRVHLTDARRRINDLEADLRTAQRDCRELAAERDQARAEVARLGRTLTQLWANDEERERIWADHDTLDAPAENAAEPPHSVNGGAGAGDGATEAHRGAERAQATLGSAETRAQDDLTDLRELIAHAIRDRLADLGTETRDGEGSPDGGIWLDGLDGVADDLAGVALDVLTESRRTEMTDEPSPIYDDDTDDPADARRYLSGSCWAGNHGECTDRACEDNCGHEAAPREG